MVYLKGNPVSCNLVVYMFLNTVYSEINMYTWYLPVT